MQQIWKDIVGYEGLYKVSNFGNVKSLGNNKKRKEKILKHGIIIEQQKNRFYKKHVVVLYKNGKRKNCVISRLVFQAFNRKIPKGYQIDHINNQPDDNRLQNLQILTCSENQKKKFEDNPNLAKSYKHNLQVINPPKSIICLNNGIIYESIMDASRKLNLNAGGICSVLAGRYKQTCGYRFSYT